MRMCKAITMIVLSLFTFATASMAETSDSDIAQTLIQASIAIYDKACACPYHLNSKGQECARSSAYRRNNGGKLLCYRSDVTPKMISRYKERVPVRDKAP